jgi:hypothetical protein
MKAPLIAFAALTFSLLSFSSCGETDKHGTSEPPNDGNSGGAAGQPGEAPERGAAGESAGPSTPVPDPIACGRSTCKAIVLGGTAVAPCCVDPMEGTCGADVPPLGCQPLTQPGKVDNSCPARPPSSAGGLPLPALPGCCREDGQCGYFISDLGGLLPFTPGCIDSTLLSGENPTRCGAQPMGAGGAPSMESGQGGGGGAADGTPESGGVASGGGGAGGAVAGGAP